MFANRKHNVYNIRGKVELHELQSMFAQALALFDQAQFMIGRIRIRWDEHGYNLMP